MTAPRSSFQRSTDDARLISSRNSTTVAAGMLAVEVAGGGDQFVEVGEPFLPLAVGLGGERLAIAGQFEEAADDLLGRVVAEGGQLVDQEAEVPERPRGLLLEVRDVRRLAGHRQEREAQVSARAARCSSVVLPIPRGGTFTTRPNETSSFGLASRLR